MTKNQTIAPYRCGKCAVCQKELRNCLNNFCADCSIHLCEEHSIHLGIQAYCVECARILAKSIEKQVQCIEDKREKECPRLAT